MLNQRNLLDDSHMLSFFKSLETSNIFQYFQTADIIQTRNSHLRLITCFKQIPNFFQQIKVGIVYEIFVNTDHPEEYTRFITNICSERIKAYTTFFQTVFYFKVWSIWEEREYLKLFSSIQILEFHPNNPYLAHVFDPYQRQNFIY